MASILLATFVYVQFFQTVHLYLSHEIDQEKACLVEDHNNPCHLSIAHLDAEHGCHHQTHLLKHKKDCKLCELRITKKFELAICIMPCFITESRISEVTIFRHLITVKERSNLPQRAPPVFSV